MLRRFPLTSLSAVLLAPLGAVSLAGQSSGVDPALEPLRAELERLAAASDGTVGVAVLHLESGRSVAVGGDEAFPMASTYKVPIAVQLLTRVDRGELSLDSLVALEPGDLHPGSGTLTELFDDPGVILSVRNLMELMLLISDNSATDLTLRLAGGPEAVTERMRTLGIDGIRVDRPTSVLIGDFVGVPVPPDGLITPERFRELADQVGETARDSAAAAFAADPRDTATPRAMARLLERIWRREALSGESTAVLVDVLERVSTGEGRLKGMLPEETVVAHKTGTIGGTTNDVGILYLPGDAGHVVTAVFVKDAEEEVPERERTIAQIARAVHDYFLFVSGGH